jgi:hypothetical protein
MGSAKTRRYNSPLTDRVPGRGVLRRRGARAARAAPDPALPRRRDLVTLGLAPANVTRSHPPELEDRSSSRHDRVLSGELPQRLFVISLDNREAV